MRKVTFQELSQDYLNQLVKGAFLTVKHEGKVNTMTIGWGTLGYIWNRPIMMVPVRYSRYTHELIAECELHIECKIVYKQAMDLNLLDPQAVKSQYVNGDAHVLYYGEILAAYYIGEEAFGGETMGLFRDEWTP